MSNRRMVLYGVLAIVLAFAGLSALIGSAVHAATDAALREQPGDPVLALIAFVESPDHTLRERNRAVWALGQLGDARALVVLEKHFTGAECDHDRTLCQHELRKAVRLCRGAANMSSLFWR